ncbi:MAG: Heimdall-CTERM domain-containing surface protein [Candidatus Thorarchaeota archaeon]
MLKSKLAIIALGIMIFSMISIIPGHASGPVAYSATYVNGNLGITIDGNPSDWSDIPSTNITLESAVGLDSVTYDASVSATFNDSSIAFLVTVKAPFNTGSAEENNSALGLLFVTNGDSSAAFMGGTGTYRNETSAGSTNIWHWHWMLDDYGQNVPIEQMYANSSEDKTDDSEAPSLMGTFTHTGGSGTTSPANGTTGYWYAEIIRDLTDSISQDVQFSDGNTYYMNVAYWSPTQSAEGWTMEGHYVGKTVDSVIALSLSKGGSTPGFEAIFALGGLSLLVVVSLKKKKLK